MDFKCENKKASTWNALRDPNGERSPEHNQFSLLDGPRQEPVTSTVEMGVVGRCTNVVDPFALGPELLRFPTQTVG